MEVRNPVIVLTFPRSGSSLVTNIIHQHGFDVGESSLKPNKYNKDGYFENKSIKEFLKKETGGVISLSKREDSFYVEENFIQRFNDILQEEGLVDKDWVLKLNSGYYPILKQIFPDAVYVCCKREQEAVFKSLDRTGFKYPKHLWSWNQRWINRAILDGASLIDFERIVNGDYRQILEALRKTNKEPDMEIIERVVKPEYKNF